LSAISVTVLISAYNEEGTIADVFQQAYQELEKLKADYEIILCDDASRDSTKKIIAQLLDACPRARAIYHQHNQGMFKTFDELYHAAGKELVILFPGDGQWSPHILTQAIEAMAGCDVVVAARLQKQYTLFRKINSWFFNELVRVFFGVDLYDIGAVKLIRRSLLQGISVETQGAFSEAERLLKAHKAGHKIGVIWVQHNERRAGKAGGARLKYILQALKDLIVFRFRY